jgi:hypothetical protein
MWRPRGQMSVPETLPARTRTGSRSVSVRTNAWKAGSHRSAESDNLVAGMLCPGVERVHRAVVAADVDGAARHRQAGVDGASSGVGSAEAARGGIQRMRLAVATADVDGAALYRRAGVDVIAGVEGPADGRGRRGRRGRRGGRGGRCRCAGPARRAGPAGDDGERGVRAGDGDARRHGDDPRPPRDGTVGRGDGIGGRHAGRRAAPDAERTCLIKSTDQKRRKRPRRQNRARRRHSAVAKTKTVTRLNEVEPYAG